MMNVCAFFHQAISDSDLKEFVEELGGSWERGGCDFTGKFRRGRARVNLAREPISSVRKDFTPDEREDLERRLGHEVRSFLSLHFGSSKSSVVLVEHIAFELLRRWGGTIDMEE